MSVRKTHRSLVAGSAGLVAAFVAASGAVAGGQHGGGHGHADGFGFGEPGMESEVSRTIEVIMGDNYFEPETISVRAGETVLFVVRNDGEFLHEYNIGTAAMHAEHQEEMTTMMEHGMLTPTGIDRETTKMEHGTNGMSANVHDDPNSVLVEPGQTEEVVWKFAAATELEFACNVPGHYQAGMVGRLSVSRESTGL